MVWESHPVLFFACICPVFLAPFTGEAVFTVCFFFPCHRLNGHIDGVYFCSVDPRVHFRASAVSVLSLSSLHSLKSGRAIPLTLFFFLKVTVALCGLSWFHINFKTICSNSDENALGVLKGIAVLCPVRVGECTFSEFRMDGIMWYALFPVWFSSLGVVFLRSIQTAVHTERLRCWAKLCCLNTPQPARA